MPPLRQHLIAALPLSGKGERTQEAYVREVRLLAQFSGTSPHLLSAQELQDSFLHRTNVAGLAPASLERSPPSPPRTAKSSAPSTTAKADTLDPASLSAQAVASTTASLRSAAIGPALRVRTLQPRRGSSTHAQHSSQDLPASSPAPCLRLSVR